MPEPIPLIPMTQRQLALMSPEEQRDYWLAVHRKWTRITEATQQRDHQADCDAAVGDDDWVR